VDYPEEITHKHTLTEDQTPVKVRGKSWRKREELEEVGGAGGRGRSWRKGEELEEEGGAGR